MEHKVFTVFDDKANCFMPPFFQHTTDMAKRVFADAVRQNDHPFHLNPLDYTLYEIGVFDDSTGQIMPSKKIIMLSTATEVLEFSNILKVKQLAEMQKREQN